jgi:deoxyribose-phosphate aldolase
VCANFSLLNDAVSVAALIDHTLLKPEAVETEIVTLCQEASTFGFASVCVNPFWAPLCASMLAGTSVKVCTVVGFPLGANASETKLAEARQAISDGARELDMVLNIGALRSKLIAAVDREIEEMVRLASQSQAIVKVILETCLLTDEEIVWACRIAARAGAAFVKTSTGFSRAGASARHVRLMRETVGPDVGVKASGGVRTLAAVREMVAAGANRVGTSSGVAIVRELANAAADPAPKAEY